MPIFQFKCEKCETEFEERFYTIDEQIFHSDSDTKVDSTDFYQCPSCDNLADKVFFKEGEPFNGWCKGNCFTNRERERKFHEKGLDKQEANRFYKESMAASLERRETMGEVYKKVDPDMNYMRKNGKVKKLTDEQRVQKAKNLKNVSTELHKIAKIDPLKKK